MYRFFCRKKRLVHLLCVCITPFILNNFFFHDVLTERDKVQLKLEKQLSQYSVRVTKEEQPLSNENAANGNSDDRQPSKDQNKSQQLKNLLRQKSGGPRENETEWKPPPNAGEKGVGVVVNETQLNKEQKRKMEAGVRQYAYNQFLSDFISLHRSLPEVRRSECLSVTYPMDLPETSVVIIFYNEAFSTLLRTVHSVLDRSPPHLLRQVILVDDASDLEHLKRPLDDYVSRLEKVKVVRMRSRRGLIGARIVGFSHVTAPTVVFLDSHCECTKGWLEPMLDRIAKDPTTVVVPVIDIISEETFAYLNHTAMETAVNTFNWDLSFGWISMPNSEKLRRKSDIEPVRTPVMCGGLFAINTDFFTRLGTYDPSMKIWGGENLELSFKIWMCGGTMETTPCSHVGHVYRGKTFSGRSADAFGDYYDLNVDRVALVWMDDYRVYYKDFDDEAFQNAGDISARQELRHRLKCHSFAWYMKNVLPERYVPADRIAHGQIQNPLTGLCIAAIGKDAPQIHLKDCRVNQTDWYMNPNESTIILDRNEEEPDCLDYSESVLLYDCDAEGETRLWKYSQDLQQLYHVSSGLCAEVSTDKHESHVDHQDSFLLMMTQCDPSNPRQQWMWDTSPVPGPSWRKDMAAGIPVV